MMDKERQTIVDKLVSKEAKAWIKRSSKLHWKNSKKSQLLRAEGNYIFANDNVPKDYFTMEEIHKLYSQSIALAECDSEELAFAYSNRSAILLRMKKYKECITDIDSALKLNTSKLLEAKLLCRKAESMIKLGLTVESGNALVKAESLVGEMKDGDTNKKTLEKVIEKLKNMPVHSPESESKKCQETAEHIKLVDKKEKENPFDSVSIEWNEKFGRHLVANRDFEPGEILFVEKPYVQVPHPKNLYSVCGHCLAECWATIPCDYCRWCMFCSEDCKKESWELYHKIECPVVEQVIKREELTEYDLLTVRALALGLTEAGNVQKLKEEIEKIDACTDMRAKGFLKNGSFQNLGFLSMYTLSDNHVDVLSPDYILSNSVFYLITLMQHTSVFGENIECNLENLLMNDEALFIGSLFLKVFKISETNCVLIPPEHGCKYSRNFVMCKILECCIPGYGIMILKGLLNHDCHPQVTTIKLTTSNRYVACNVRPIEKDSQVTFTYGVTAFGMSKKERQSFLKEAHNFTCVCKPCEENWPSMTDQKKDFLLKSELNALMPIMENDYEADCTLDTVKVVSDIMRKLYKKLKHPSQTLWTLENCMIRVLYKLYKS